MAITTPKQERPVTRYYHLHPRRIANECALVRTATAAEAAEKHAELQKTVEKIGKLHEVVEKLNAEMHEAKGNVDDAAVEHFAKEAGLDLAGISVVNAMGVLHEFMLDGYRARKDGVTAPPDVAETTKIATAILQFQAKAGPSHARVFQDAIVAIMEELQQLLDPATLAWVIRSLEARPEVQAAIKADAETQQERRALAG